METFAERFEEARAAKDLPLKRLASMTDLSEGYLYMLRTGRRKNPSLSAARRIAEALGASLDWLYRGTGGLREAPAAYAGRAAITDVVPILGYIPAGRPLPPQEEAIGLAYVPEGLERRRPDYALVVRGESMGGEIQSGDVIFVRQQATAEDGEVVVAVLPDPAGDVLVTLKRWHLRAGYAVLEPGNIEYRPLATRNVRIEGVIVGKATREKIEV